MMRYVFGIWTILVALMVSAIAAYYSIVGLAAIFAAAIIPIIIMGAALEVAKITAAVWLHNFWNEAPILTKIYLTSAIIILMLITSMGIFGFLSKAHIAQSAKGSEMTARIDRASQEILRQGQVIERSNLAIRGFDSRIEVADTSILDRIKTQERLIADISGRAATNISVQNQIISQELAVLTPVQDELKRVRELRQALSTAMNDPDVRTLQAIVGTKVDGVMGPKTRLKMTQYVARLDGRQQELISNLEQLQAADNPIVQQARTEITQIQKSATAEIARAQEAINAFRNQLVQVTTVDNTIAINEQNQIIDTANNKITDLFNQRFELEGKLRAIEVEVGPVKYIAELIYGNTNKDLLEKAVRWVIIALVIVFDPLAIVLVISGISLLPRPEKPLDNPPEIPHNTLKHKGKVLDEPAKAPASNTPPLPPIDKEQDRQAEPAPQLNTPDAQILESELDTPYMNVPTGLPNKQQPGTVTLMGRKTRPQTNNNNKADEN